MLQLLNPDRVPKRDRISVGADVLLALGFGFLIVTQIRRPENVAVFGPVEGFGWLLVLGPTALITVRRFAPALALAAAVAFYLVAGIEYGEGNALLAIPPLAYMVAATRPPRVSVVMCGLGVVLISLTTLYGPGNIDAMEGGAPLVILVFFGIGWAIGAQVRRGQLRQLKLTEQAEATQAEIDALTQQAVADERSRIARELHDAVGHAVNLMVMHAGAERLVTKDEQSSETFQQIERIGRSALADLDGMLGLLHADQDGAAPTAPTHGFADIARLIEDVRSAGGDVYFEDHCRGVVEERFEGPIGAAVYRIVQEALTNAVKHAGPARIDVSLSCDDDEVVVRVIDDGRGSAAPKPKGGGRGIVGMRERAMVHNGELTAGPRVGGGFQVEARLPRTDRTGHRGGVASETALRRMGR